MKNLIPKPKPFNALNNEIDSIFYNKKYCTFLMRKQFF